MRLIPRVVTGAMVGQLTGLLTGALSMLGGAPLGSAVLVALALGVPLALFGAGYDLLVERRRFRAGGIVEVAGYFALAFPVARLLQTLLVSAGRAPAEGWFSFLTFQALMGSLYGLGFLLLHIQVFVCYQALRRIWRLPKASERRAAG